MRNTISITGGRCGDRSLRLAAIASVLASIAGPGCRQEPPSDRVRASGTIEVTEVRISSTVGGTVVELHAAEGIAVQAGDVIARIDDRQLKAQLEQAEATLAVADAQLRILLKGVRDEDIRALRSQWSQANEAAAQAQADFERVSTLVAGDSAPAKAKEDAQSLLAVREAGVRGAAALLSKAVSGARPEEIELAEAQKRQASALVTAARDRLADTTVTSKGAGIVTMRLVEAGEVVGPGAPIATVADTTTARLKVFVSGKDLGKIRVGQAATASVDSYPERRFEGRVTFVSSEAEFTPRNVQTAQERVKTVYGVRIELPNPDGVLKAGMPADAEIPFSGDGP